uniref:Uncharacterized protein n=1 Tax=Manihot esculenta TaxID=3983 RepID=A0A2C9WCC0_MANES
MCLCLTVVLLISIHGWLEDYFGDNASLSLLKLQIVFFSNQAYSLMMNYNKLATAHSQNTKTTS